MSQSDSNRRRHIYAPIDYVVKHRKAPEVIRLTLHRGTPINEGPIFGAAQGNPEPAVFRLLGEQGADVNRFYGPWPKGVQGSRNIT